MAADNKNSKKDRTEFLSLGIEMHSELSYSREHSEPLHYVVHLVNVLGDDSFARHIIRKEFKNVKSATNCYKILSEVVEALVKHNCIIHRTIPC